MRGSIMVTWKSQENETLKKLYVEKNMTSDTLIKDKGALEKFTSHLILILQKEFRPREVAEQLLRLRKSGKLPRIRR